VKFDLSRKIIFENIDSMGTFESIAMMAQISKPRRLEGNF
jgi:hypothetical protein